MFFFYSTLPETNIAGWKIHLILMVFTRKDGIFMGELLVSGRVPQNFTTNCWDLNIQMSGQIIFATEQHDRFPPNGGLVEEIPENFREI